MRSKNKTFTLIEMLVVVVIIGVLATALIPKIQGAQSRARDIKRIADIKTIGDALRIYKSDIGSYPLSSGGVSTKIFEVNGTIPIEGSYITSIPKDSDTSQYNLGFTNNTYPGVWDNVISTEGYYGYLGTNKTQKPGVAQAGVLISRMETTQLSNRGIFFSGNPTYIVSYVNYPINNALYNSGRINPVRIFRSDGWGGGYQDVSIYDFRDLEKYICTSITKKAIGPNYLPFFWGSGNSSTTTLGDCRINTSSWGASAVEYRKIDLLQ